MNNIFISFILIVTYNIFNRIRVKICFKIKKNNSIVSFKLFIQDILAYGENIVKIKS